MTLLEYLKITKPNKVFTPSIIRNNDGNLTDVMWEDAPYYIDRTCVEAGFRLYRAQDNDRVVGIVIYDHKGCGKTPGKDQEGQAEQRPVPDPGNKGGCG